MKQSTLFPLVTDTKSKFNKKSNTSNDDKYVNTETEDVYSEKKKKTMSSTTKNKLIDHSDHCKTAEFNTSSNSTKQSVSYEDFVNETFRTVRTCENNLCNDGKYLCTAKTQADDECLQSKSSKCKDLKISEMNNKQSLSYKDFLTMFKSAPISDGGIVVDSGAANLDENENDPTDIEDNVDKLTLKKEVNLKSITSYFKPMQSNQNLKASASSTFTVTAEIHSMPSDNENIYENKDKEEKKTTSINTKDSLGSSDHYKLFQKDEIILISSETIDEAKTEDEEIIRKRKFNTSDGIKSNKLKLSTSLSKKKKIVDKEEDSKDLYQSSRLNSRMQSPPLAQASGQCKLSFGASGLTIAKVSHPKPIQENPNHMESVLDEGAVDLNDVGIICADTSFQHPVSKLSRGENLNDSLTSDQKDISEMQSTCDGSKQGRLRLRTSKLIKNDNLGPEAESRSTSAKEKSVDKNDEQIVSTPVLRRSSRVKLIAESAKKEEIIEVDENDDCEVNGKRKPKEQNFSKKVTSSQEKTGTDSSQRVSTGKLAPIFTKLRPAEDVKPPFPTPEELEKQKLRRDFLMSGIPEELKRAKAAMALQLSSEYPPFPCPSHIQQMDSSSAEGGEEVCCVQQMKGEMTFDWPNQETLKWDLLGWPKLVAQPKPLQQLIFQDFISHSKMEDNQMNLLVKKLEENDKSYPFQEVVEVLCSQNDGNLHTKGNPSTPQQADVIVVDDLSPIVTSSSKSNFSANGHLWTDDHPISSKYIVGNAKNVQELKDWLQQWHVEMQREAKKVLKESKNCKKKAQDWSDDSDFTDSSDEDNSLCNTMLITGPHGIGKTSTVYCLAEELGFKVFEVNPTSLRSGKQLQSQLEEATQSHRVTQRSASNVSLPGASLPGTPKQADPKISAKPVNKAFSSFFNKANPKQQEPGKKENKKALNVIKSETKKGKKSKKTDDIKLQENDKQNLSNLASSLNISSASIILFDEADVVFEDDRGFQSTLQHFMSSTKIPIIITSTNPTIHSQLLPRHEHLTFKRPSIKTLSSFLHSVCLARGLRIFHKSLLHLITALKQDIRQCLLHIQFWCESGGGTDHVEVEPLLINSSQQRSDLTVKKSTDKNKLCHSSDNSNDSEFLSLRPSRKRQRRMVLDDEDSNSTSNPESFTNLCEEKKGSKKASTLMDQNSCQVQGALPSIHLGCDAFLIGGETIGYSLDAVLFLIKQQDIQDVTEAVDKIIQIESRVSCNALYSLAFHCCSLPKVHVPVIRLQICTPENKSSSKKRKRILIGDWLDSDSSDEDEKAKDKQVEESSEQKSSSNKENENELENKSTTKKTVNRYGIGSSMLCSQMVDVFSKYYENMSSMQFLYGSSGLCNTEEDKQCILPGVTDDEILSSESDFTRKRKYFQEICGTVELQAVRTFVKSINGCLSKNEKIQMEEAIERNECVDLEVLEESQMREISLPVGIEMPDIWSTDKDIFTMKKESSIKNVASCVGSLSWTPGSGSQSALHLDYLPALREICRTEHDRQENNTKRRFIHYLDHSGLNLKDSTITSLTTMYTMSGK